MAGLVSFGILILVIWAEIIAFGMIGDVIGVLPTIIGIFVTAAIGIRLFRRAGRATLQRMAENTRAGTPPVVEVADGAAIILAAILLLIPGYVTDLFGFILFIPGIRTGLAIMIFSLVTRLVPKNNFTFTNAGFQRYDYREESEPSKPHTPPRSVGDGESSVIIEGEYQRKD
jgi:UPF0716 protein FxsA